jgi:hypothetical protein
MIKIDLYSNMHNEETILPYWLRHYETIADRIFIWDDESTDATHEILSKNPKVTFLEMGQHGDDDAYWVASVFPQYEQHSIGVTDWVIIADADEFVYHPRLSEVLEEEKNRGTQVIQCVGYSMVSDNLPTTNGQIYEEIKNGLPDKTESKWTVHAAIPNIRFAKGRHGPIHGHRNFVCNRFTGIKLLHYRYLGEEYIEKHDRTKVTRAELIFRSGLVYSRDIKTKQPDGTKDSAINWFNKHKMEAVNVVDEVKT